MSGFRYSGGDRPLDGYTIGHALGRGGFGEVYFAKSDAGREVALKVIQNYEDIELRGVTHCMNLKSSHLVTIFDVKHDGDKRPWVVMEYVAGPCLKELLDEAAGDAPNSKLRSNGIGEDQAMYFMRELIKGMRYLHDSGVVHRDLKPHNIFFEDGTVKIGDYSLSKAISTSHHSGHTTTVGSVHYMAPEIGEGNYGKAVDIYAMGVILFEMLTGNPPYLGESLGEVLIKHLTQTPDVEGLNPVFGRVITKAMERKPEDRFQSVDEMLHALCPEDHSSYLPAPASLSMIGDRAAKRRAQPSAAKGSDLNADTFAKMPSLVDTREDSQSQPFERPRVKLPGSWSGWLTGAGLLWRPSAGEITGPDASGILKRGLMAFLVGWAFALLASLHLEYLFPLIFLYPAVGAIVCWLFLQTLPRALSGQWNIISRLVGALIVVGTGFAIGMMLPENQHATSFKYQFSKMFIVLLIAGIAFDWRCLIEVGRYPRVGLIKTFVAMACFWLPMFSMDVRGGDSSMLIVLSFVASTVLIVQILAPHGQIKKRRNALKENEKPRREPPDPIDRSGPETRYDNESFVLKEEV